MNISNVLATIVVVAAIGSFAFVGFSENPQAFSFEESEIADISMHDSVAISDSVTISVNGNPYLQD